MPDLIVFNSTSEIPKNCSYTSPKIYSTGATTKPRNGNTYKIIKVTKSFSFVERAGRVLLGLAALIASIGFALFFETICYLFTEVNCKFKACLLQPPEDSHDSSPAVFPRLPQNEGNNEVTTGPCLTEVNCKFKACLLQPPEGSHDSSPAVFPRLSQNEGNNEVATGPCLIDKIPPEVASLIFERLTPKELKPLDRLSKPFSRLVDDSGIWLSLMQEKGLTISWAFSKQSKNEAKTNYYLNNFLFNYFKTVIKHSRYPKNSHIYNYLKTRILNIIFLADPLLENFPALKCFFDNQKNILFDMPCQKNPGMEKTIFLKGLSASEFTGEFLLWGLLTTDKKPEASIVEAFYNGLKGLIENGATKASFFSIYTFLPQEMQLELCKLSAERNDFSGMARYLEYYKDETEKLYKQGYIYPLILTRLAADKYNLTKDQPEVYKEAKELYEKAFLATGFKVAKKHLVYYLDLYYANPQDPTFKIKELESYLHRSSNVVSLKCGLLANRLKINFRSKIRLQVFRIAYTIQPNNISPITYGEYFDDLIAAEIDNEDKISQEIQEICASLSFFRQDWIIDFLISRSHRYYSNSTNNLKQKKLFFLQLALNCCGDRNHEAKAKVHVSLSDYYGIDKEKSAFQDWQAGLAYYKSKNYIKSEMFLIKALNKYEPYVPMELMANIANLYLANGQPQKAQEYLERVQRGVRNL